jgi:N-acetylglucosaminyldiphosphoundecaprenol N-acetyl-beta-D-mannosaminyltransferase
MNSKPAAKLPILGIGVSTIGRADVVAFCEHVIEERRVQQSSRAAYVCVTSVHGIITGVTDQSFRAVVNAADVVTPDGMPVVWALRSFGARTQERVYGPDLMLDVCDMAQRQSVRVYLYGATDECLAQLHANLMRKYPDLSIVGMFSPPFRELTDNETLDVTRRITESGADLLFVGLSTPKQEKWMAKFADRLPNLLMIGVGAAFDFHAGRVKQAPSYLQRAGLEWLYRLYAEPRRLWKRYILITPWFLPLWGLQLCGFLRYNLDQSATSTTGLQRDKPSPR